MSWIITGSQKVNWDPSLVSTALWLDAADASTVTTVNGNVSQWNDKSGNDRNAAQSTAGNRPLYQSAAQNGLNAVRFTAASSHFLTAGTTSTWNFLHNGTASSIFIVAKVRDTGENPNAGHAFFSTSTSSTSNTGVVITYDDSSAFSRSDAFVNVVTNGSASTYSIVSVNNDTITPGSYNILSAFFDADNGTAANRLLSRINGGSQLSVNTQTGAASNGNSSTVLNIGRRTDGGLSDFFAGDFCEVLFLASQPDTIDRQKIEGYLAHKWGLTANLPNDHPYKVNVPTP